MSSRKNIQIALGTGLTIVAIVAGLYFFTDIGKNFVNELFDKSIPQPSRPAVVLMPPFSSKMSVREVSKILTDQQLNIESKSNFVPKLTTTPAKNLDTLTVLSFSHYDISGKLILEFLNDELYEVAFYPYVAEEYAPIARNKLGLRPNPNKNGRSEQIQGHKRIASNIFLAVTKVGKSLRTKPYVIWQDLHLLNLRRQ